MSDLRAYERGGSLILSDEPSRSELRNTGRWIASTRTCDLWKWE